MKHSEMIDSIVETERHAQQIAAQAEARRSNLDAEVAQEVAALEERYRQQVDAQVAQAKAGEEQVLAQGLAQLEEKLSQAMDDIEKKKQIHHDQWVQALFERVLYDKAQKE